MNSRELVKGLDKPKPLKTPKPAKSTANSIKNRSCQSHMEATKVLKWIEFQWRHLYQILLQTLMVIKSKRAIYLHRWITDQPNFLLFPNPYICYTRWLMSTMALINRCRDHSQFSTKEPMPGFTKCVPMLTQSVDSSHDLLSNFSNSSFSPSHINNRSESMKINLYASNVHGLRTKSKEVYRNSSMYEYDIHALNETWLNEEITSSK